MDLPLSLEMIVLVQNGGECYVNHGGQMWTGWDGSRKQLIDRDTISVSTNFLF